MGVLLFLSSMQKKLDAWYCDVALQQGTVTFGRPMAADGQVGLKMYDTRPLVALLKEVGNPPGWLSLMPNVKDVDGTADLDFGKGFMELDNLVLNGKGLQVLGTVQSRNKKTDGQLFIKYKSMAAGVSLDQGKAKVHLSKPRKWYEARQGTEASPDS